MGYWLTNTLACTRAPDSYKNVHTLKRAHVHTDQQTQGRHEHSCLLCPIKERFLFQSLSFHCSQHTLAQFFSPHHFPYSLTLHLHLSLPLPPLSHPLAPPFLACHHHLLSSFTAPFLFPSSNWTALVNRRGRLDWTTIMTQSHTLSALKAYVRLKWSSHHTLTTLCTQTCTQIYRFSSYQIILYIKNISNS